jgi:hypothetical protein
MGVLGGFVSLGRMLERHRRVLFAGLMIFVAAVFRGCVVTLGCVLMVLRSSEMCFSWHQSTPFNSFLGPRDGVGESWEAPRDGEEILTLRVDHRLSPGTIARRIPSETWGCP